MNEEAFLLNSDITLGFTDPREASRIFFCLFDINSFFDSGTLKSSTSAISVLAQKL